MVANMSDENPYEAPKAELIVESNAGDLATRGARLGGSLIDGLIAMAIIWPAIYFLGIFSRLTEGIDRIEDALAMTAVGLVSFFAINGYLLANYGQTVGKRLVKTRIVSVHDGKILPFWKVALVRYGPFWLVSYIPIAGIIMAYVNPLFIFRRDRRCLHDHIAGTKVVVAE